MAVILNKNNIGKIIKYHRKQSKLTQKQLADMANLGKSVIFDIEKGKTSIKVDTLLKVLPILNIDISLDSPLIKGQFADDKTS